MYSTSRIEKYDPNWFVKLKNEEKKIQLKNVEREEE